MQRVQRRSPAQTGARFFRRRFSAVLLATTVLTVSGNLAAATYTVTNTNDAGAGSLREAILSANGNPGADIIDFDIPPGGVQTISPLSTLGQLTGPVTIDGTTQPGFAGSPIIELSGANATGAPPPEGLNIANTQPGICVVRGLVVNRWPNRGILLQQNGGNVIQGNYIGTDVTGMLDLGNAAGGISIVNGIGNVIGGTSVAERNVISGNDSFAIDISGGSPSAATLIQGNFIGTSAAGTGALGNSAGGIFVQSTEGTQVGGTAAGAGNRIAFNGGPGVTVAGGTGNAIRSNAIYSNAELGIDLAPAGVTLNDSGDADGGSNNLQNFPVLTTASSTGTTVNIQGMLNSSASMSFTLEFFSSSVCDGSAYGEGQTFLGSALVMTDAFGNAAFSVNFPVGLAPRDRLTGTATDSSGNTSEFSACISLLARFYTLTPCRIADTRDPNGPYGGPALMANSDRVFEIIGQCGIPSTAQAVSFNFAVISPTALGDLRVYPAGGSIPGVSTMNYRPGQIRANNAVVPLGPAGEIAVRCVQANGTAHFIVDINGYFE